MNACNRSIKSIVSFPKQYLSHLVPNKSNTKGRYTNISQQNKHLNSKTVINISKRNREMRRKDSYINEDIVTEYSIKKEGDAH